MLCYLCPNRWCTQRSTRSSGKQYQLLERRASPGHTWSHPASARARALRRQAHTACGLFTTSSVLPQTEHTQTVQQSCQCAVQCTLATPTQPDMWVCWNNAQYTRTRTLATLVHQEWIQSQLLPTTGAGRPPAFPYDTPLTHLYPPAQVRSASWQGPACTAAAQLADWLLAGQLLAPASLHNRCVCVC